MRRGAEMGSLLFFLILAGCAAAPAPPVYITGPPVPNDAAQRQTTRASTPRARAKAPAVTKDRLDAIEQELRGLRDRLPD